MTDAQKLKLKLKLIATAVAFGLIAYSNAPQFEDRVSAFSSGPPASHTGAPGEQTCTVCHFGGDQLKASKFLGGNGIVIGGLPTAYVPSTAYVLTATLTHTQSPNNTMYGFQLTAVEGTGSTPGAFSLTHMPGQMQIVPGDPPTFVNRSYIQHTISGTVPAANGSKTWQFTWTAPSTDVGPITFHAAGNAADQSGDETGDIIYVTSATVNPEAPAPEGTAFDFDGDSKTDVSIFRPGPGEWWYLRSSDGGNYAAQFGS
ncbi:MAG: hypothetical protein HKN33_18790, partial [Pyrinomonadaceae bacterium]|nr:hypothetical protein [Pyrinomonadaceae bacterium]